MLSPFRVSVFLAPEIAFAGIMFHGWRYSEARALLSLDEVGVLLGGEFAFSILGWMLLPKGATQKASRTSALMWTPIALAIIAVWSLTWDDYFFGLVVLCRILVDPLALHLHWNPGKAYDVNVEVLFRVLVLLLSLGMTGNLPEGGSFGISPSLYLAGGIYYLAMATSPLYLPRVCALVRRKRWIGIGDLPQ